MAESQRAHASSFQPLPLTNSTGNVFKGTSDSPKDTSAVVVEAE